MAGEDDMLQWLRPARGKGGKIAIGRARFDQRGNPPLVFRLIHRREQRVQPMRPALQRLTAQFLDHARDIGQVDLATLQLAGQVQPQLEHGIEQRRLRRQLVQFAQSLAQSLGHQPYPSSPPPFGGGVGGGAIRWRTA